MSERLMFCLIWLLGGGGGGGAGLGGWDVFDGGGWLGGAEVDEVREFLEEDEDPDEDTDPEPSFCWGCFLGITKVLLVTRSAPVT